MRREELTSELAEFENKQPVDTFAWNGWRAWPVVRAHLALALHAERPALPRRGADRIAAALRWRGQRLRRRLAHWRPGWRPDRPADLVFVTHTDRCQRLGGVHYNTVVDPWVEALRREGGRASVWDLGDPRRATLPEHHPVQHVVDAAGRHAAAAIGPPPAWFAGVAEWIASRLEGDVGWREIGADLALVERYAAAFEPWLRRAAPRALVLDGWYLRDRMGAALAAHRLGIPTVDLQHGIQGRAHPAYAGWHARPAGGYEVFPGGFWVWGEWDAESLRASNAGAVDSARVQAVGHRWLEAWRAAGDPRLADARRGAQRLVGARRAVLVTLQKGVDHRESLVPLVRAAPADWSWLVRAHRSSGESAARLERELRRETGSAVEVVRATRLPLYALLGVCAWHATGFSTCALEALPFGVPTLLLHPSGAHAYAAFVAEGAMVATEGVSSRVARLAESGSERDARAEACRGAAARVFAPPAPHPWRDLLP